LNIKSLQLKNYRNYENLNLNFNKRFNVIYGNNAQGKTNIIEAIFVCASGRSHRTSKDYDLLKIGSDFYYINLELKVEDVEKNIEIIYDKNGKKRIKINEIPLKKIGELMGNLNAVMFSPEDILLIKEGPSERRRFVDITISQFKPSYFFDLQQYAKIILQRNALLKNMHDNIDKNISLDIWNENLAKTGARIIKARNEFIKKIDMLACRKHMTLTNYNEKLNIKYNPSIKSGDYEDVKAIEKDFLCIIEHNLKREIAAGTTLAGPQRDDIDFLINDKSLKIFGSQGQQRTAMLALKLSEVEIIKEYTASSPVLLLDDVMSELDSKRRQYLFENIGDVQTFITTTEKSVFENIFNDEVSYFYVEQGVVFS